MKPTMPLKTFKITLVDTNVGLGEFQGADASAAMDALALAKGYRSFQSFRRIAGCGYIRIDEVK